MPYCTRCGKKIEEGERCSCQKNVIDFEAALQNKNPVNQFFGLRESSRDPKVRYERNMKIIPARSPSGSTTSAPCVPASSSCVQRDGSR